MLALDARFALLVIFCGISTRWIAPGASVSAAAISRTPNDQGLRDLAPGAQRTSSHAQHVLPWPDKTNGRTTRYQKRDESLMQRTNSHDFTRSKVRMNDFTLANPFQKIADAVYSSIKRKGHHKRSKRSVIIPTSDGSSSYQVNSETAQWRVRGKTPRPRRRQAIEGTPGVVAIESNVYNSTEERILGYLYVNATFVLNASDTNKTVLYLFDSNTSSRESVASASDDLKPVKLCLVDDNGGETKCATYFSNPPTAESMTMEEHDNPPAGTSQIFMFNATSGGLNPTTSSGTSDSTAQAASSPDNSTISASTNTTASGTGQAKNSTGLAARDSPTQSSGSSNTQSVKLIFIPSGTAGAEADDPALASPPSAAGTTTMTTTQTVTATNTSASGTATAANSAPSASQSAGGLSVELVGDASSPSNTSNGTQASSSNSGAAIAATPSQSSPSVNAAAAATQSSSATASPSINAGSVAASIAASASSSKSAALASMSSAAAAASASAANSASGAAASASSSASAEYIAAVMQRAPAPRVTRVSTEPYQWKFKPESR